MEFSQALPHSSLSSFAVLKSKPDGTFASDMIILMEIVKSTVKETFSASSAILLCTMRAISTMSRI